MSYGGSVSAMITTMRNNSSLASRTKERMNYNRQGKHKGIAPVGIIEKAPPLSPTELAVLQIKIKRDMRILKIKQRIWLAVVFGSCIFCAIWIYQSILLAG